MSLKLKHKNIFFLICARGPVAFQCLFENIFPEYNILCNSKNKKHFLRNTYFKSFFMITRHIFQRKISSFYSKMQIWIFYFGNTMMIEQL